MKTIYKEITPIEALKRLAEAGKPIEGFVFRDSDEEEWERFRFPRTKRSLLGVTFEGGGARFLSHREDNGRTCAWAKCAELIEEAPKPWTFETCPRGYMLLRNEAGAGKSEFVACAYFTDSLTVGIGKVSYYDLAYKGWQHSLDGGKTWLPCTQ